MKTHNETIYHCLCCGKVVHNSLEGEVPQCCGSTMIRAATTTVEEPELEAMEPERPPGRKVPPVIRVQKKPR